MDNGILFQCKVLQDANLLVQVFLAFPQPIVQGVGGYGHPHIRQPLMQKAESHILYINLISDGLQELRSGRRPFKTGNNLGMTLTREIAPFQFAAGFHIMHHFKALLHQNGLQAEYRNGTLFDDASGNLRQIRWVENGFTGHSHCLIFVRTIGQVPFFPGILRNRTGPVVVNRIHTESVFSPVKIVLLFATVRLSLLRST